MSESQSPPSIWVGKAFPAATFPRLYFSLPFQGIGGLRWSCVGLSTGEPNVKGKKKAGLFCFLGPSSQNGPSKVYRVVPPDMVEMHTGVCCEYFYYMHAIFNEKAKVVISKSFCFYIS